MSRFRALPASFYRRPAEEVAPELLGRYLLRAVPGELRRVLKIVETEAYLGAPDRASHAWGNRRTARTSWLFRPGGHAYVYFIYGVHHMLNVTTATDEDGSAVLLRAGEPVGAAAPLEQDRGLSRPPRPGDLAGGPGKLCQAMGLDLEWNGVPLWRGALRIAEGEPLDPDEVWVGRRVGVDYAGAAARWPLRFAVRGNPHVSRPRPR